MTTGNVTYRLGARSDVGRSRPNNEDAYLDELPLIAVADGMGGAVGGEIASGIAIDVLRAWRSGSAASAPNLEDALRDAHRAILERARADDQLEGMGTTITAAYVEGSHVTLAHVGDSRAYLFRGGSLQQLTVDDTLVQRYIDEGRLTQEEARYQPYRNYVTQAVGAQAALDVEILSVELQPGDRLLLASDGLFGQTGMSDEHIGSLLAAEADTETACSRLVEEANAAGGDDNITVVLLDAEAGDAGALPNAGPVIVSRPSTSRPSAQPRRRRVPMVLVAVIVAAALVGLVLLFVGGDDSTIVVGAYGDRVAILKGTAGGPGRAARGEVVQVSDVTVASLPETFRRRVTEGIPATSVSEAERIVAGLPRVLGPTDTPAPTSTPAPLTPATSQ